MSESGPAAESTAFDGESTTTAGSAAASNSASTANRRTEHRLEEVPSPPPLRTQMTRSANASPVTASRPNTPEWLVMAQQLLSTQQLPFTSSEVSRAFLGPCIPPSLVPILRSTFLRAPTFVLVFQRASHRLAAALSALHQFAFITLSTRDRTGFCNESRI
eukprot:6172977-Pleurochrysis_carterae.AAC.2